MDSVLNYLNKLLNNNDTIVLGVSGGPDSMALLSLLVEISKNKNLKIICAHVNHNLRKESFDEEVMVKNYCLKNNVIFEYMLIDSYGDDNFHNEARTKRYNFFEQLITKYQAKYLFTAHHADDLIETILMRIVRGSTLKGYSGFNKEVNRNNYKIIRPLINVTKKDILNYLNTINLEYALDKSNDKDDYTRNRYRHNIVNFLKEEDSNVHDKFLKFNNTLNMYDEYVTKQALKEFKQIYINNELDINKFKDLDHIIKEKILSMILENIYLDDLFLINDKHIKLILDLINSDKVNTYIYLPNELKVIKSYNLLEFTKLEESTNYEIELDKIAYLPNNKKITIIDKTNSNSNYVFKINSEEVKLPLIVRTRRDGDKIETKGMNGKKKVNDIFTDSKIKTHERDMWPIVTDSNDVILWIPGLNKSKYDKQNNEKYDIILKYD